MTNESTHRDQINGTPSVTQRDGNIISVPSPVEQVLFEHKEAFKKARITRDAFSPIQRQGFIQGTNETLSSLPPAQQEAVRLANHEGYFLTIDGRTYPPTKEGVERRQKREALTRMAQTPNGREALINAELWNKRTNHPYNSAFDRMVAGDNHAEASTLDSDRHADQMLAGYSIKKSWWQENKNWITPLMSDLSSNSVSFLVSQCITLGDENAAKDVIDKFVRTQDPNGLTGLISQSGELLTQHQGQQNPLVMTNSGNEK